MALQTNPAYNQGLGADMAAVVDPRRFGRRDLPIGVRPAIGNIPFPNSTTAGPGQTPPVDLRTAPDAVQRRAKQSENKTKQYLRSHHPRLAEMVDLGMPVRKAFGLAARERFSGSGQPTQANSQYRSAPYLPNPHRNYDTSGRRVFPPQYDRADGNRMALEARRGDSNLITGGMFDLTIGLGASPGTASLLTGSASFIPGVDTATSLDDARRNLDAGNFGSATIDILLATGGFIPGAGKFFRKVIERGGKRFISTKHGGINFDLLPGNALDFG